MNFQSAHIQKWLDQGQAVLVDTEISKGFSNHTKKLSWKNSGLSLDFDSSEYKSIDLSKIDEEMLVLEIKKYSAGKCKKIIFFYSEDEPCVACDLEFGLKNIDYAYWRAPGVRYMFGGDINNDEIKPNFQNILMYGGADILSFKI